jgi:hypothetical protein
VGANTFDIYRRGTEGEAMDESKHLAEQCEEVVEHGLAVVDLNHPASPTADFPTIRSLICTKSSGQALQG